MTERFKRISGLVAPRVLATLFRSVWNGWCTARRFQQKGCCRLGCSPTSDDSIEHYSHCRFAYHLVVDHFKLDPRRVSLGALLCAASDMTDKELTVMAVVGYALFRATSHFRFSQAPCAAQVEDALEQWCKVAVEGHAISSKMIQHWMH